MHGSKQTLNLPSYTLSIPTSHPFSSTPSHLPTLPLLKPSIPSYKHHLIFPPQVSFLLHFKILNSDSDQILQLELDIWTQYKFISFFIGGGPAKEVVLTPLEEEMTQIIEE